MKHLTIDILVWELENEKGSFKISHDFLGLFAYFFFYIILSFSFAFKKLYANLKIEKMIYFKLSIYQKSVKQNIL